MTEQDQRRGVFLPGDDGVERWVPTTRRQRRNGWKELIGHATRNGALVAADNLPRADRRRRARELWREGQRAQGR